MSQREGPYVLKEYPCVIVWCRVGDVEVTFGRKIRKIFGSHSYGTVS